jgi:hypothetical protein
MNNVNLNRIPAEGIVATFAGTVSIIREPRTTAAGRSYQGFVLNVLNTVENADGTITRRLDRVNCTAWEDMALVLQQAELQVGQKVKAGTAPATTCPCRS